MPVTVSSPDETSPKKGFLRYLFLSSAPGVLTAGVMMMTGADGGLAAGMSAAAAMGVVSGIAGHATALAACLGFLAVGAAVNGAAAFAVVSAVAACVFAGFGVDDADSDLNPEKVFAGTLAGAALGAAMVFGAVSHDYKAPQKPVHPAPQGAAVERQLIPNPGFLTPAA